MKGITEWDRKLRAIKLLYNVNTDKELSAKVMSETARIDFFDNIRKWHDSTPRSSESRRFFDLIVQGLECANMNGQRLIECSFDDFIASLPAKHKSLLDPQHSSTAEEMDQIIFRSHLLDFNNMEDAWLKNGHVDQLYMYLNIDSTQTWKNVIRDGGYKTYSYCISSLNRMLLDHTWKQMQAESKIGTFVIFGAGTPDKELQLIENQLATGEYSASRPLRVVIVDASHYMLIDTYDHVRDVLRRKNMHKLVDLISCEADFTRLSNTQSQRIRPPQYVDRICFFILGGTIGNIDEARFLQSVHQVSSPGDVLVVSAEFADLDRLDEYKNGLVSNYGAQAARDLVLGPVRKLLDEFGVPQDIDVRRSLVRPRLSEGAQLLCPIPGTIAVELHAMVGAFDLALSISKRYEFDRFLEFFTHRNFVLCGDPISCVEFPPYRQLLFVRN